VAKCVLVATGAEDVQAPIADLDAAIRRGIVRHCPACDAYEVRGPQDRHHREWQLSSARSHAPSLLHLRPDGARLRRELEMAEDERAQLQEVGVELVDEPVAELVPGADGVCALLVQNDRVICFDTVYVALGLRGRSELATRLGAAHDDDGMLFVDDHQHTSVPGLYAVGDVVQGLTQIGVAMGQAAIAASTINSSLERRLRPSQPVPSACDRRRR
jgi:thioredoxin reductase (NADPH)